LNLETAVKSHKTGTFHLYITAGYTNPAAPAGKQETRQTTAASLEVTAPQPGIPGPGIER
ncbi:MAG: hypothetical protein L0Y73_08840, partial [Candidatus Aminicenantes bacterium]|nr:hypothetical protein [Candidatus Aminicenantes bacterium]